MVKSNIASLIVNPSYVDEFRAQCLHGGVISCTKTLLHDKWLVTKKLADLWWELKRTERETVADYTIRNWGVTYYHHYRGGSRNCSGGEGDWKRAVCLHNAFIRYLRFADGIKHYNDISNCYYADKTPIENEYCYYEEDFGLPVYLCNVTAAGFGHSICAFQLDEDMKDFNNWQFFQYSDPNIIPGNWQMPCRPETTNVRVEKINSLVCSGCNNHNVAKWTIDEDCNVIPNTIQENITTRNIGVELNEIPELRIVGWSETGNDILLYVSEHTPENLALDRKFINDKQVYVYIAR